MKAKFPKLNCSGMSLTEVSIALAILAVLAAGSGMVVSQTLNLKFNSEAKLSAFDYQDSLATMIGSEVSRLANLGCDPSEVVNYCDANQWAEHFGPLYFPGGLGKLEIIHAVLPASLIQNNFVDHLDQSLPQQKSFSDSLTSCTLKPTVPSKEQNEVPPAPAHPGIYTFCVNLNPSGGVKGTTDLQAAEAAIIEVRAELLLKQSDQQTKIVGPQISIRDYINAGRTSQQVSVSYRILWKRLGTLNSQGKFLDSGFYSLSGQKVVNINELR